ncbi:restriction endonuclease subunit S [Streptomyces sp. NPDC050803]|uniref:restriction endonuclease subunit S n=1 Tax=unclassified Streptomyces TaxID=2593676 RepID=UPI003421E2A6
MQTSLLGDVSNFYAGASLPAGETFEGQPGGYLLVRVSDMNLPGNERILGESQRWSAKPGAKSATCPPGSVIFPKRGGAIGTNKKRLVERPCVLDPNVMAVEPLPGRLDSGYLYHWFKSFDLSSIANGSSVPQLNKKDLAPLRIPLPSIPVQRRIAQVLDRVDALRAKRGEAIALLDDLAQSIFLDMFGDPVANPKSWERLPLGSVLDRIDSGRSPVCLDRPAAKEEWGVLKLGAVTQCVYRPAENKALPEGAAKEIENEVRVGDLLFSRKNTSELVAAVAYVRNTRERLLIPDLIFRLVPKRGAQVDKAYLHGLLTYPSKREKVRSLASGSAASMPNISKAKLLSLECELPPLVLQRQYAAKVNMLESAKSSHYAHLAELDALTISLQHRAFCGELWPDEAAAVG